MSPYAENGGELRLDSEAPKTFTNPFPPGADRGDLPLFREMAFPGDNGVLSLEESFYRFLEKASPSDRLGMGLIKLTIDGCSTHDEKIAKLNYYIHEDAQMGKVFAKIEEYRSFVIEQMGEEYRKSIVKKNRVFDIMMWYAWYGASYRSPEILDFFKDFVGYQWRTENISLAHNDHINRIFPLKEKYVNIKRYEASGIQQESIWFEYNIQQTIPEDFDSLRNSLIKELLRLPQMSDRLEIIDVFFVRERKATLPLLKKIVDLRLENPYMPINWLLNISEED